MAYRCELNPDGGSYTEGVPIHYPKLFSNPDVSYLGMPTGTATENNAQTLRDNMVRLEMDSRASNHRRLSWHELWPTTQEIISSMVSLPVMHTLMKLCVKVA